MNMSREEWCNEQSYLLRTSDNRLLVLMDIKEYIINLPHEEAREVATLLQLPLVFDCLNSSNNEQIQLACEILTICLSKLDVEDSTAQLFPDLGRALNHPLAQVKTMALNEILRTSHFISKKMNPDNYKQLLRQVIMCIGDESLSVAAIACEIIKQIGTTSNGVDVISSKDMVPIFSEVMAINEIVCMRLFEVIIDIARTSSDLTVKMDRSGFLKLIIDELDNSDILVRLNVIEVLIKFVSTDHGYVYLEKQGVIQKLCNSLTDTDDVTYTQLCEPGILKFFGHVAHQKPDALIDQHSFILDRLFDNLQSTQGTILGVSINTLSYIVDSDICKLNIDKAGDVMCKSIVKIVEGLGVYPNEIKVQALHCLANFLNVNSNDRNVTKVTRKWYGYMQGNPMDFIMGYAKNPIAEIRMGGLVILNCLAKQQWGQEQMRNTPGLVEFLLDRNIERVKECKEIKYEIVKRLADSSTFSREMRKSIQNFVEEGPFYVQGVTEIGLEGDD